MSDEDLEIDITVPSSEDITGLIQLCDNPTLVGNHILEEAQSVATIRDASHRTAASKNHVLHSFYNHPTTLVGFEGFSKTIM